MRRWVRRFRRCKQHDWGGWRIDDDTGIASRKCLWCPAIQLEQLARHKPARSRKPE